MEKQLVLDYWNNFRHFDDGLDVFLAAKKITKEYFNSIYKQYVTVSDNPWIEDRFKNNNHDNSRRILE